MSQSPPSLSIPQHDWGDLEVVRAADTRVLVAVAVAAVGADLAVRSGVATVAGALLVVVVTAGLLASGRVVNPAAAAVAAVAPVFGVMLALRTSAWLVPLDILAAAGLLAFASSLATGGSPFDLTLPALVARAAHAFLHALAAPGFVLSARRARKRDEARQGAVQAGTHAGTGAGVAVAVVRGFILAAPVVALLGLLLASADPVFASLFRLPTEAGDLTLHAALLTAGAWGMAGLLRVASTKPVPALAPARRFIGIVEATTVMAAMAALYVTFVAAQVVTLTGGARHVLRTSGLTYAEYARSGFFQLLAAATVTLAVLLALRALAVPVAGDRWFVVLAEVAVVLTLAVVAVAIGRLRLYEQAYGLTMLRLYSTAFAVWIAAVFVFLGVSLAGVGVGRAWLVPAAGAAGLVLLAVLNVANPEALVVEHNVAHARITGRFDAAYVTALSDDAIPALVQALPALDPVAAVEVRHRLCWPTQRRHPDLWGANASARAAEQARRQVCGGPPPTGSANVRSG